MFQVEVRRKSIEFALVGIATLCWLGSAASAQPQQPREKPAEVSSTPSTTTATFGEWSLRCQQAPAKGGDKKCDIIQSVVVKGQQGPFAQFVLARAEAKANWQMAAILPVNVLLTAPVKLAISEQTQVTVDLKWLRCVVAGCVASGEISPTTLKLLRENREPGQARFQESTGRSIVVPIRFTGLAQAIDAYP